MAVVAAASNIPLAFHDRLSTHHLLIQSLLQSITQHQGMLNDPIAPTLKSELLNKMKVQLFLSVLEG